MTRRYLFTHNLKHDFRSILVWFKWQPGRLRQNKVWRILYRNPSLAADKYRTLGVPFTSQYLNPRRRIFYLRLE